MGPFGALARKYKFAGFCLLLAMAALAFTWGAKKRPLNHARVNSVRRPVTRLRPERAIYPYSVIPGGVLSNAELGRAVARDRVAADHYQDFSVQRARLEVVARPRLVFVSYRVADRVYWTRKRVLLKAGETILSDGAHQARTRCGNRIADTPQAPTQSPEPDQSTLDTAVSLISRAEGNTGLSHAAEMPYQPVAVSAVTPDKYLATFGPASVSGENAGGTASVGGAGGGSFGGGGHSSGSAPGGASGGSSSTAATSELPPGNSRPVASPVPPVATDQTRVPVPGLFTPPVPAPRTGQPAASLPAPPQVAVYVPAATVLPPPSTRMDTLPMGPAPSFPMPQTSPSDLAPPPLASLENATHLDIGDFVTLIPGAPKVDTGRVETDSRDASHVQVPEPGTWLEGLLGTGVLVAFLTLRRWGRNAA